MKHYGHCLPWAGRPVTSKADDIVRLHLRRETLLRQLRELDVEIEDEENNFEVYISCDWSSEEITEAKQKSESYNNNIRIPS